MGGADLARALKVFNEHFGELAGQAVRLQDILLLEILYSLLGTPGRLRQRYIKIDSIEDRSKFGILRFAIIGLRSKFL